MSRTVFIQARETGEPMSVNCYTSWVGFTDRGCDVRKFTPEQLPSLPLDRSTIVHGGISMVQAALQRVGAPLPAYVNIPESVASFAGRDLWETTLGEIRQLRHVPVFVKPQDEFKSFTGYVVREFRDLLYTVAFPDDYPVFAQGVVEFLSEWRVYVLHQEILGIGHYKGNPLLFPDAGRIRAMLDAYRDPIIAHSLDVGVTSTAETLLVEMNDAYALGSYGLSPNRYARMLEARWDEMCAAATD